MIHQALNVIVIAAAVLSWNAFAKVSPLCEATVAQSTANIENIKAEYEKINGLKQELENKQSVVFVTKLGCPKVYFQNWITGEQDYIIDIERELSPLQDELALHSKHDGWGAQAHYWTKFVKDFSSAFYQLGSTGTGAGILMPQFRSTYLNRLKAEIEKRQAKIIRTQKKIEGIQTEMGLTLSAPIEMLEKNVALVRTEFYRETAKARPIYRRQLDLIKNDRACFQNEIAEITQAESGFIRNMDKEVIDNLLENLEEVKELNDLAEDVRVSKCTLRGTYYSGARASLIPRWP